jgi:signal transduction histidine kinase
MDGPVNETTFSAIGDASSPAAESGRREMVYRQIVDNGRAATGARIVVLSGYDAATGDVRPIACSGLQSGAVQRGIEAIRAFLPGFDISAVTVRADANACQAALYAHGRPISASLAQFAEGVVDSRVVHVASAVVGIRHSFAYPVKVQEQVVGALSFHTAHLLTDPQQRVCETFATLASATLENAGLLLALRGRTKGPQPSVEGAATADERMRREKADLLYEQVRSQLIVVRHRLGECERLMDTDPIAAKALLAEVRAEMDSLGEENVRKAGRLLPSSVIRGGLVPAVRSLAARFSDYFRVVVRTNPLLERADSTMDNRITEPLRLAVYRVLEEALSNVYRHAEAGRADIVLEATEDGCLTLTVRDDGHGFDPDSVAPGLGLSSIAERVSRLGGVWGLNSGPGQGTALWARIPLTP